MTHRNAFRVLSLLLITDLGALADTGARAPAADKVPPAIRYEAVLSAGGALPPGGVLSNPYKGDTQTAQTGASLFTSMNCDGCHGGDASGWVGPSLSDGRWRYGGAEDEVFHSIYYGRPKGMPAFGGVLGADGIWMLVTYLQSLPVPTVVPTESWTSNDSGPATTAVAATAIAPPMTAAAVLSPERLLTKYGCVACHALDHKVIGPALKDVAAKYHGQTATEAALVAKVRNGGGGVWGPIPMTPNPSPSDAELSALIKWIISLK